MYTFKKTSYLLVLFCWLFVACQPDNLPTPVPGEQLPVVGTAENTSNNVLIRVDWVEIDEEVGDLIGNGELYFDLWVIREGDSRRLRAPGEKTYQIDGDDRIELDGFSLSVNEVDPDEKILIYFLAFDSDEFDNFSSFASSVGLEGGIYALEQGLEAGLITGKTIKNASPIGAIISVVSGSVLTWWEDADPLGAYATLLEPKGNWQTGKSYDAVSAEENMRIHFSITSDDGPVYVDVAPPATPEIIIVQATPLPTPPPLVITATPPRLRVESLTLINADTDKPIIMTLENNMILNLSELSTRNLNIRANVSDSVESVLFKLDGEIFCYENRCLENLPPYSMAGDTEGDYFNWELPLGTHTIQVIPYSKDNVSGTAGTPLTIRIVIK